MKFVFTILISTSGILSGVRAATYTDYCGAHPMRSNAPYACFDSTLGPVEEFNSNGSPHVYPNVKNANRKYKCT